MPKHLKTRVISRFKCIISRNVPHSEISATHARGVRYCEFMEGIDGYFGKMNSFKEGRRYKKHIIVRSLHNNSKVHQIYTYHFPKTWSAACVTNRELIKEAQRRAHALERDHSLAGLEWRTRFFKHYFRVFRCGEKPEPGMKRYSRFYQYTYVAIYRELKAAQKQAEEVSFEPINDRPLRIHHSFPIRNIFDENRYKEEAIPPLRYWQNFCKIVT